MNSNDFEDLISFSEIAVKPIKMEKISNARIYTCLAKINKTADIISAAL